MTLIIGIPACSQQVEGQYQFAVQARFTNALLGVLGAISVLLPPQGEPMLSVLGRLDGLLLPGSPSNVHPDRYGTAASLTPDRHDPARDATTLPLARAAIARGLPLLAVCRGCQELNVALGGTLHQQVHAVSGRADHRAGQGTPEYKFRLQHLIRPTGQLAAIAGPDAFMVNSLHEQAIDRPADGLAIEALAEDGTIEAVRVAGARAFAIGVQFHPEWHWATDRPSRAIFEAFGRACRAYRAERGGDVLSQSEAA